MIKKAQGCDYYTLRWIALVATQPRNDVLHGYTLSIFSLSSYLKGRSAFPASE